MISKTGLVFLLVVFLSWNVAGEDGDLVCAKAIRIFPNGDAINGNLDTLDNFNSPYFGVFDDVNPAWWYVIAGTGGVLKADTCSYASNFDTSIAVYSYSGDCENLEFVGRNDDAHSLCDSSYSSSILIWETEQDVDYYIGVRDGGMKGDFHLEVRSFDPVINDFCDGAIPLTTASEFPILGSTNNSYPEALYCGDSLEYEKGVWYSVRGTGGALAVSACSADYEAPSLYIFSGTCDDRRCLATSTNTSGVCEQSTWGSLAMFPTEADKQYFIYVAEYIFSDSTPEFELTISDVVLPPNSYCSVATELLPDATTTGSFFNSTTLMSDGYTACGYPFEDGGVWYFLMGTGDVFFIYISAELSFESVITVSKGPCNSTECVTSDKSYALFCDLSVFSAAKVVFISEIDVEYHVLVQHQAFGQVTDGEFGLTVTSTKAPPNINCSNPVVLQLDNGTVTGRLIYVTGVIYDDDPNSFDTVGAWFSLVGTGEEFEITTCSSNLNFDSAIRILTGPCEDPELIVAVAGNDYGCDDTSFASARAVFRTEPGVTYLILVQAQNWLAFDVDVGEFGLTVSTVEVSPKYVCSGATIIELNHNRTIQGYLVDATEFPDMNYGCTPSDGAPSAWYSLLGTGGVFAISTCSRELNFDSVISVAAGSCEDQQCTHYNSSIDQACGSASDYVASRVVVPMEMGVQYWIAIQALDVTRNATKGKFGLTISSVLPSLEDLMAEDKVLGELSRATQMSGLARRNLLASLLVTVSIEILPLMMNLWLI